MIRMPRRRAPPVRRTVTSSRGTSLSPPHFLSPSFPADQVLVGDLHVPWTIAVCPPWRPVCSQGCSVVGVSHHLHTGSAGRHDDPGRPLAGVDVGPGTAVTIRKSGTDPFDVNGARPFRADSSPWRTVLEEISVGSAPAPGSVVEKTLRSSPARKGGEPPFSVPPGRSPRCRALLRTQAQSGSPTPSPAPSGPLSRPTAAPRPEQPYPQAARAEPTRLLQGAGRKPPAWPASSRAASLCRW